VAGTAIPPGHGAGLGRGLPLPGRADTTRRVGQGGRADGAAHAPAAPIRRCGAPAGQAAAYG